MRMMLKLDNDVAELLRRARATSGGSREQIVNEALRRGLRGIAAESTRRKPFRTKSVSLGRRLIGDLDSVSTALAAAEGEGFR